MATNLVFHACTWHIDIDLHFIRELVTHGALHLWHVPMASQLVDLFTKGLSRERFQTLCVQLQLGDLSLKLRRSIR
ncbi:hypothetical protein Pint_18511 [Pistacia integerrima]|uniref:Uncharacterized protein n=1 Tax=Pistacia integerrima TaxID=434235 RepID=A0ACC0YX85_9ROSI|nr:hypothetical protein Pint_18511 [Pistacia integerrima]